MELSSYSNLGGDSDESGDDENEDGDEESDDEDQSEDEDSDMDDLLASDVDENTNDTAAGETNEDIDNSCPICLGEFDGQRLGNPENCRHIFCLECIQEWTKVMISALHCDIIEKQFIEFMVKFYKPTNFCLWLETDYICQLAKCSSIVYQLSLVYVQKQFKIA